MAVPAGAPKNLVQGHEENGMVDREREGDVPHVSRTVDIIQTTSPTRVIFSTGAQSRVVESSHVGMEQAVECIGVGNLFAADLLNFLP